ncbi:MAG TPA: hypothetical protein VMT15_03615 [Bryobacteraceae bacterium]|nr:hypothetical protein [Bryobacteraceae bacterium]
MTLSQIIGTEKGVVANALAQVAVTNTVPGHDPDAGMSMEVRPNEMKSESSS